MEIIKLILEIAIIILSLVIVVAVALQKSKSEGITGVTATSESDNYFGRGKELGAEAKLARITKVCVVLFVIVSVVLTIVFSMEAARDKRIAAEEVPTETQPEQ